MGACRRRAADGIRNDPSARADPANDPTLSTRMDYRLGASFQSRAAHV
jgi:hypothetical protein